MRESFAFLNRPAALSPDGFIFKNAWMIERGREAADVAAAATAVVITNNVAVTVPTAAVTCLKTLLFQNLVSIAILKFVQPF